MPQEHPADRHTAMSMTELILRNAYGQYDTDPTETTLDAPIADVASDRELMSCLLDRLPVEGIIRLLSQCLADMLVHEGTLPMTKDSFRQRALLSDLVYLLCLSGPVIYKIGQYQENAQRRAAQWEEYHSLD